MGQAATGVEGDRGDTERDAVAAVQVRVVQEAKWGGAGSDRGWRRHRTNGMEETQNELQWLQFQVCGLGDE